MNKDDSDQTYCSDAENIIKTCKKELQSAPLRKSLRLSQKAYYNVAINSSSRFVPQTTDCSKNEEETVHEDHGHLSPNVLAAFCSNMFSDEVLPYQKKTLVPTEIKVSLTNSQPLDLKPTTKQNSTENGNHSKYPKNKFIDLTYENEPERVLKNYDFKSNIIEPDLELKSNAIIPDHGFKINVIKVIPDFKAYAQPFSSDIKKSKQIKSGNLNEAVNLAKNSVKFNVSQFKENGNQSNLSINSLKPPKSKFKKMLKSTENLGISKSKLNNNQSSNLVTAKSNTKKKFTVPESGNVLKEPIPQDDEIKKDLPKSTSQNSKELVKETIIKPSNLKRKNSEKSDKRKLDQSKKFKLTPNNKPVQYMHKERQNIRNVQSSKLPIKYPVHFTKQRPEKVYPVPPIRLFATHSYCPNDNDLNINFLTPELSQVEQEFQSDQDQELNRSLNSTPSLSESLQCNLRDVFGTKNVKHILGINEKVVYKLREQHVQTLAIVLNLHVEFLKKILNNIIQMNESFLQKLSETAVSNILSIKQEAPISPTASSYVECSQSPSERYFPSQKMTPQ